MQIFSLFFHLSQIINPTTTTTTNTTFGLLFLFIFSLSFLTLISIGNYNSDDDYYPSSIIISPAYARPQVSPDGPVLNDPNLVVETVYQGLKLSTSMAFLGPDDILVLEKGEGTVQRLANGEILPEPLLQVDVTSKDERGLLGIAISSDEEEKDGDGEKMVEQEDSGTMTTTEISTQGGSSPTNVFLFFTEAGESTKKGDTPAGNRVYKYDLVDDNTKLTNPTLLLDLPATPDDSHVGGALQIGPDNNLYLTIGDQRPTAFARTDDPDSQTKAQNYVDGKEPDGRAGILRITLDGETVVGGSNDEGGIFGNEHPLNKYYAYGVKNSFGIDFDPVTGNLWDTENGPTFGDEINLVEPGSNGGWSRIQGFWTLDDEHKKVEELVIPQSSSINAEEEENNYGLVDFDGKGKYSSPKFVWDVAPTAISFLDSDKLGQQYENDIFVGDAKYGNLYHFKLDEERTGLLLDGPLEDKVGTIEELEQQGAVFGHGFGVITDIEVGPDGYLYILTFGKDGNLYRIFPTTANSSEEVL